MSNGTTKFKPGDWVALSATFLRSIDPSAAKGWPTRYDLGTGLILDILDEWLATVAFINPPVTRTINVANLIHKRDVYLDAMKAEHNRI